MTDRDKLRERVADVIVKSWDEDEEYNSFKCADAAIAVVLEEVAAMIERKHGYGVSLQIAAEVRAMKPESSRP